jgi:5-formyltetrahydrofolate cyclo-ligase
MAWRVRLGVIASIILDSMRAPLSKEAARERGKAVRAALSRDRKLDLDRRIVARCQETVGWSGVALVHMFVPIVRMKEIDTWPLLRWIWAVHPGIEVYVPRVVGHRVQHVRVSRSTEWAPNAFGIPEPIDGAVLDQSDHLDVVLIPLLACDRRGYRVGYGGGYYDRFLDEHPEAQRIGLVYDDCVIDEGIAEEAHDIALQIVITEAAAIPIR